MRSDAIVGGDPRIAVLVVCTANICRSPLYEAVLRHELGAELAMVGTLSAGTEARAGTPIDARTLATLERWDMRVTLGRDHAEHRARPVRSSPLRRADLIVTMERHQLRHLSLIDPDALARAFTAVELARAIERGGPESLNDATEVRAWARGVHATRRMSGLADDRTDDDVADPIRSPDREFRRRTDHIAALAADLGAFLRSRRHRVDAV